MVFLPMQMTMLMRCVCVCVRVCVCVCGVRCTLCSSVLTSRTVLCVNVDSSQMHVLLVPLSLTINGCSIKVVDLFTCLQS